jgi:hypothetical protein
MLPVQLDLPHGRWVFGQASPPPVTNYITFAVDMSSQIQLGNFHTGSGYTVFAAGDFNNWPGPGGGFPLTNYPAYNGGNNTNIYYGTYALIHSPSPMTSQYKFNQNDPAAPNGGWETSNNRSVNLPATSSSISLSVVSFSDYYASDFLSSDTPVTFSVDMAGAVGTDGHVFDPQNDLVYINGQVSVPQWYAWYQPNPINPPDPAPASCQMIESNNSTIYTNTLILPAGTPLYFQYKYGMVTNGNANPSDNEAPSYVNHTRVARNTGMNPYAVGPDKFGAMYSEPFFTTGSTAGGNLTVGAVSGGKVPVQWLGRPGAQLQWSTSLTGSWQTVPGTDGTNWLTGYQSTNGFVSTTNWPATGANVFFRLVKPN